MNADLQAQNMRISQDSLINSSYNFLSINRVGITNASVGRASSRWPQYEKIILESREKFVGDGTAHELELVFYANAFDMSPISEVILEEFELDFDVKVSDAMGYKEQFYMNYDKSGLILTVHKINTSMSKNDYSFALYCYIPHYPGVMFPITTYGNTVVRLNFTGFAKSKGISNSFSSAEL